MLKSFNSIRLMSIVFIATLVTNGFIIKDALAGVGDSPLVTKQKWSNTKVTYDLGSDLSRGFKNAVDHAGVMVWNGVSSLEFEYSGTSFNDWGMRELDNPAVTQIYSTDNKIIEVNTYFNELEQWNTAILADPDPDELDALTVAIHEFGHWFRLRDTYDDMYSDAMMYGYIDYGEKKVKLSYEDIDAAQTMYP
ncbi:matrixin family metalloprotease [Brevibacillus panacihumi]|uniref:matrixin family metalloprotease n=1 Tax=Brevibacillus panacihumi TaxID=497735 RepID=UPI003D009256